MAKASDAMSPAAFQLDSGTPDTVAVSGTLSFTTAAAALDALNTVLAQGGRQKLDLAAVSSCDSAGLACVLAALAAADSRGQAVRVQHAPDGMRALATVCGVEQLIA
ncbi:MAG: STAS domain-containing protein [Rhodanobacter sp.]